MISAEQVLAYNWFVSPTLLLHRLLPLGPDAGIAGGADAGALEAGPLPGGPNGALVADFAVELAELGRHGGQPLRLLLGQVGRFADVVAEVVELEAARVPPA